MGTLFSTFDIARSGMQASQVEMEVSGHNIANVNRQGYSRQRVSLGTYAPNLRSYGALGRGVKVQNIERVRETFLDTVYRQQSPSLGAATMRANYFNRIEDLFQEPGPNGFNTELSAFFNALNDFADNVEEQPVRMAVITEAESLAASLNQLAQNFYALRTNVNEEVKNMVPQINQLASQIAQLNQTITDSELNGNTANDLRDERDNLLDQLSALVNINSRERTNGQVDVMISGETLVNGIDWRPLETFNDPSIDPDRGDLVGVRYKDTGQAVSVRDGALYGAITMRDDVIPEIAGRLDEMTAGLILAVNRVQSAGNGIENLSGTLTSANAVSDPAAALVSGAGLPYAIASGSFDVVVYDSAGNASTTTVNIDAATTLQSLAADLAAIPNFAASVGADNRIQLGAAAGYTYSFANDSAGALPALGVNTLFTGHNAATIGVSRFLIDNPRLLSSAYSTHVGDTGDNAAALDLAMIQNRAILDNGTATVNAHYESTIVRVGVDGRANSQAQKAQQAFIDDFQKRRDEVSGVSIDEEVTNMLLYQRAYEASARVINMVNSMLDALLQTIS